MTFRATGKNGRIRTTLRTALMGPQILAFLPALTLGGYWYGGEGLMLYMALLLPALFALAGLFSGVPPVNFDDRDGMTGLPLQRTAEAHLEKFLGVDQVPGKSVAALLVSIDDFGSVARQFGTTAADKVLCQVADRLRSAMRDVDLVFRVSDGIFGIAMAPVRRTDLETLIQVSVRLQNAVAEPISVDATSVYVTASVGFCSQNRAPQLTGEAIVNSAQVALNAAMFNGVGSIRAYSPEIKKSAAARGELSKEAGAALEAGEISAWFQPQISTDTGRITGFEALARWQHPKRGQIAPQEFLPVLSELGQMERLSEVILYQSLAALRAWDDAGRAVPRISVNFSQHELGNPKVVEKIRWELDRFNLSPDRLCVEVLENVIADSSDDTVTRNIVGLSELGCKIDLDDFGTGHASIASIRRFAVDRIKIDRSFVTRVDRDREQQNMVAAVLTMAERLGLDTLAEGVETVGEHAMLAQLGCKHVQGFSVARPMPVEDIPAWIDRHNAKLPEIQKMSRKTG